MTTQTVFLAKHAVTTNDIFEWRFGEDKAIKAQFALFYRREFDSKPIWVISGRTGNFEDKNYFAFAMSLPYIDDEHFPGIHKLSDGLTFTHSHWIPAPEGFDGLQSVNADSAWLNIKKYDSISGTVEGSFEAVFKSHGYRLNPKGTFTMTRLTPS
ncbi:hypothetical protein SAMN04490189_0489 [Pseudomonas koreensis]|nr:hypothetical protein F7R05_10160 [Pseudomonas koreensis]MCM8740282.1 hypothetical protein [Pseudomonas koreensis]NNA62195.1 hypothetical protein [Pseudomonas koreensis]SDC76859.1 hypothetical protein SAMN04490189_0489 [Pseudomonas koreensis]